MSKRKGDFSAGALHDVEMFSLVAMKQKYLNLSPDYQVFLVGILFLGINNGILNSTFNNYLYEVFTVSASDRGLIEFPREFPGFALIFVTMLLSFFSLRIWAVLVGVLAGIGIFGLAFLSPHVSIMIVWMFFWSLGDHLFMPVESIIGLKLASEGREGRRLGQISGIRNLALIGGTAIVYLLMEYFSVSFKGLYFIAFCTAMLGALSFSRMSYSDMAPTKKKFVYRGKYNLYYAMNLLFGARKQLFLTFSPWLMISVYGTKADTIAILMLIAALLGFVFRQYFGILTDRLGEKVVLTADAVILFVICLSFAYVKNIYVLYAFFILDSLMFSTRIARTTYLNKILVKKDDLTPTLSLGISVDHAVSMLIPLVGGLIWEKLGFQNLFLMASILAILNLLTSLKIKYEA